MLVPFLLIFSESVETLLSTSGAEKIDHHSITSHFKLQLVTYLYHVCLIIGWHINNNFS